jgi:hypothetical protein
MTQTINSHYRAIERVIEKMTLGLSHLLFVRGPPGLGKSFQIERSLKEQGLKYFEVSGDTSDAYLYRILYENNGRVVWFKDVVRLLKSLRSLDLLKSACESKPERLITNLNYSDKQTDLPKRFVFKGKLIFDFNSLVGLRFREDFEALASRGDFVDVVFSHGQVCEIMRGICQTEWQREVTDHVIANYVFVGSNSLNLRTQHKAFQCYQYAAAKSLDWRQEVNAELRNQCSKVRKLLYPILGDGPCRAIEVKRYLVRSGLVSTMRTADRRIADWLELGDLYRVSTEERNFLISLQPITLEAIPSESENTSDTSDSDSQPVVSVRTSAAN